MNIVEVIVVTALVAFSHEAIATDEGIKINGQESSSEEDVAGSGRFGYLERAASTCNGPPVSLAGTSKTNPYFLSSNQASCKYTFDIPANTVIIINMSTPTINCNLFGESLKMGVSGKAPSIDYCSQKGKVYAVTSKPDNFQFEIVYSTGLFISNGFSLFLYANNTVVNGPSQCKCGTFTNRIVGGFVAPANAYPYQIGLMLASSTKPFCGGTIISTRYVLTAAHCTKSYASTNGLRVSISDVDFTDSNDGGQYINVAQIMVHPNYNSNTQENDFSLLQLQNPITFSTKAGAACLPPDTTATFAGANLTISGWGLQAEKGSQSQKLKAAFVKGISNADCIATGYKSSIKDSMICAYNYPRNDTDTCQGDSGGPLVANLNGKATLVGVTSFGIGCAGRYPGVYARVTSQKAWILQNSDAGSCQ